VILAVDSSAVVAVVRDEPPAAWLVERLEVASTRLITAANAFEVTMVLEGRTGARMSGRDALSRLRVGLVAVDEALLESATTAWRRFGKGRHRAALDFGDCFSYALAASRGIPLLCVGADFAHTDLDVLSP
jgi:ribonuclease VapC